MKFNHLNPEKLARALSLTGGGVRGVFTSTILEELESRIGCDFSKQFDVFVGTSVGGIIAVGLACGMSGTGIAEALRRDVARVFGSPVPLNPWALRSARHRPDLLAEIIAKLLGKHSKTRIRDLKTNIVVPSIDAADNTVVYFSNLEHIGSTPCLDATLLDVALATSAAPTYFPPHCIEKRLYLDGGIASNNPDIEALRFCTAALSRPLASCLILSVGSGKNRYVPTLSGRVNPGLLGWMGRHKLIDRVFSLQESKSSDLVTQLIGDKYARLDTHLDTTVILDDIRQESIDGLVQQGRNVVRERWELDARRITSIVR